MFPPLIWLQAFVSAATKLPGLWSRLIVVFVSCEVIVITLVTFLASLLLPSGHSSVSPSAFHPLPYLYTG